jgi:RNA polymerase sigma factor (sigma-70 family)
MVAKMAAIGMLKSGGTRSVAQSDSHKFEPEPHDVSSRRTLDRAYRSWWGELCRVIERQFGPGPPDPEEAVQSAFEKFAKLEDPASIANPRAYLHTSSRNYVLDQKRRAAVRLTTQKNLQILESGETSSEIDSERVLIAREELAMVDAAVRDMEPRRREVLIMHSVHGLTFTEIGKRLGVSERRVRQLMASALALCAAAIDPAETSETD